MRLWNEEEVDGWVNIGTKEVDIDDEAEAAGAGGEGGFISATFLIGKGALTWS